MATCVLGLAFGMHDSAAAVVQDGRIVAAVEEERLSRAKHSSAFPVRSIDRVLEMAGISLDHVSCVAFSFRPNAIRDFILQGAGVHGFPRNFAFFRGMHHWYRTVRDGVHDGMRTHYGYRGSIVAIDHHLAHAASAYYCSPFDRALVVTADGTGDRFTFSVWRGEGTDLRLICGSEYPASVGLLYSMVTYHLGLGFFGEGKTMGLAAFGEDVYHDLFDELLVESPSDTGQCGGAFHLNGRYLNLPEGFLYLNRTFNERALETLGPRRDPGEPLTPRHANVAASLQARLERFFIDRISKVVADHAITDLCMAGGVALNGVLNGRLLREGHVRNLFVQPAAGDAGTSLGAALFVAHTQLQLPRAGEMRSCALGPEFTGAGIVAALRSHGLAWRESANVAEDAATLLAGGRILGWFQGRMEFGPRALGQRSILANPCVRGMQDHLNARVKFREAFRPFGASVPVEDCARYFDLDRPSPFMLLVSRVREPDRLPAITHVDGSVRLQTIDREVNGRYWELHRAFERQTGIPVLLNTSFNVKGEPIVCTPDDAIRCLLETRIDHLVIGDYVVDRPAGPAIAVARPERDHAAPPPSRAARYVGALRDGMLYLWFFLRSWGSHPDHTRRFDRIA